MLYGKSLIELNSFQNRLLLLLLLLLSSTQPRFSDAVSQTLQKVLIDGIVNYVVEGRSICAVIY